MFADLFRGFFRVFGRTKITVLLGFTVAAYNLDRIRSFRAKQAEDEPKPVPRAKRRQGTWTPECSPGGSASVPAKATGPPDQLSHGCNEKSPFGATSSRLSAGSRSTLKQNAGPEAGILRTSRGGGRASDSSPPPTVGFMKNEGPDS